MHNPSRRDYSPEACKHRRRAHCQVSRWQIDDAPPDLPEPAVAVAHRVAAARLEVPPGTIRVVAVGLAGQVDLVGLWIRNP